MTIQQFSDCMSLLFVGIGKPVERQTVNVYFELLGHHDADKFRAGCKKVLLSHRWATFPSIAELNDAAFDEHESNETILKRELENQRRQIESLEKFG